MPWHPVLRFRPPVQRRRFGKRDEGTGAGSVCGKVLLRDNHSLLMQSSVLFGNLMQSIVPSRLLARSSKHDWPNNVWLKLARVA